MNQPTKHAKPRRNFGTAASCMMAAWALAACSASPVVPKAEFPPPVLNQIPVPLGLYMDNGFKAYEHTDKPPRGLEQKVSVGPASRVLFKEFLSAQFRGLVELPSAPDVRPAPPKLKAVLQPVIQDVQISSPRTEKDAFYEAWIKYRLHLLTNSGDALTSWEVAAYGKHRSSGITGANADLTAAVRDALRDAAAGMALIFRDGPTFQSRLEASLVKQKRSNRSGTSTAPTAKSRTNAASGDNGGDQRR